MTNQIFRDDVRLSIASMPATALHRRLALASSIGIAVAFVLIAAIGLVPMPRSDGFIPAVQGIIASVEFITAVLLFSQYAAERSPALLLLAAGYLFTALIVIAQTLTFPGAFSPSGLFGAGPQTAPWLYVAWHCALPAAALGYAWLKQRPLPRTGTYSAPSAVIRRTVLVVVPAAAAITWATILGGDSLPTLLLTTTTFASTASAVTAISMALSALALGAVWRRRSSVLDEWLLVALVASLAETALVVFIGASRYTLPFYTSRTLAVVASSALLVALLSEMTGLYVRLSRAVNALQRERSNKLMNLDVVVSSIAHEIKQPLMVITTCNTIIAGLLRKPSVDAADVQVNLDDVTSASIRIGETIDSLRGLFKDPHEGRQYVDMNGVVVESLQTLTADLSANNVAVTTELTEDLPLVVGHRGQLREVLINIIQNAVDELARLADRPRTLTVRTGYSKPNRIFVAIEDSGDGIAPDRVAHLFTTFVSTKTRGMGLGLKLCQMIVDRHDGEMAVTSEIGQGTRFEVSLPFEPVPVAKPTRGGEEAQRRSLKSMP
jgi:signal transduction histidine kinase